MLVAPHRRPSVPDGEGPTRRAVTPYYRMLVPDRSGATRRAVAPHSRALCQHPYHQSLCQNRTSHSQEGEGRREGEGEGEEERTAEEECDGGRRAGRESKGRMVEGLRRRGRESGEWRVDKGMEERKRERERKEGKRKEEEDTSGRVPERRE
eukprot:2425784-Rhodomonas_salina.1